MTDNEKFSASEIVIELQAAREWFTAHGRNTNTAIIGICDRAINFIKKQNAEIENLTTGLNVDLENFASEYDSKIKAEAVKEFAERVKAHTRKMSSSDFSGEFWDKAVLVSDINNLVKEMTAEVSGNAESRIFQRRKLKRIANRNKYILQRVTP